MRNYVLHMSIGAMHSKGRKNRVTNSLEKIYLYVTQKVQREFFLSAATCFHYFYVRPLLPSTHCKTMNFMLRK